MNAKNLYLDNRCLGDKMLLVGVTPDMYVDGQRVAEPVGYKYDVCLKAHQMDKLSVRIPGKQLMDAPLPEADVYVRFEGLVVRPYVANNGRMAFTASATGIHRSDRMPETGKPKT